MPVYQGRDSCMARREGWFVRRVERPGIDTIDEAVALAWAVLRDYRRGYTYDNDNCRKIKMTWGLAEKRLRYIRTLAVRHGASGRELRVIERLIDYVLSHRRLPKTVNRRSMRGIIERMRVKA